jgi:hypothetical protein
MRFCRIDEQSESDQLVFPLHKVSAILKKLCNFATIKEIRKPRALDGW